VSLRAFAGERIEAISATVIPPERRTEIEKSAAPIKASGIVGEQGVRVALAGNRAGPLKAGSGTPIEASWGCAFALHPPIHIVISRPSHTRILAQKPSGGRPATAVVRPNRWVPSVG
jgi:hypothetical protein